MLSTLAQQTRNLRLEANYTQKGLAARAGVSYATLRAFERTGQISLLSFVKIIQTLGREGTLLTVLPQQPVPYQSIDDVLQSDAKRTRKRGRRT